MRPILIFIFLLYLTACDSPNRSKTLPIKTKKEYRELMISSHKVYLQKEKEVLNQYVDSIGLNFVETASGLRFSIYESKGSSDSIQKGDIALVNYTLQLLNGDTAYQTIEGKPQEFIVALDNVEPGLHEGIQEMAIGDKAILILPAHLAHGVSGDNSAIPPQSPIVYNIELLAKR